MRLKLLNERSILLLSYSKNLKGEQYVVHCRRMAPGGEGPGHVDEVMETGSGAPEEEVLLDENKACKEYEFYHVGEVKFSPNHKLLAVTEDFTGDEVYTLRVIDIETGQSVGKPITGVTERIEWAMDNETIFYVTQDEAHRPYKVWLHKLHAEQSDDTCLYHEQEQKRPLDRQKSESDEYIFVYSNTKVTQFILYLSCNEPNGDIKPLSRHIEGEDYFVTHRGDHFYGTFHYKYANVLQQPDNSSCGVFALAYAIDIAYKTNPQTSIYNISNMRQHLRDCITIKNNTISKAKYNGLIYINNTCTIYINHL